MCYPCAYCNRCGKVSRMRALEAQCPRCNELWTPEDSQCKVCGYERRALPKEPEPRKDIVVPKAPIIHRETSTTAGT